jgi:hypothetical protein
MKLRKRLITLGLMGALLLSPTKDLHAQTLDKIVTDTIQVWPDSVGAAGKTIEIYATPEGGTQRMRTAVTDMNGAYSTHTYPQA